ncbi:MAG TPA: SufD family Fe-S cluster assembly protein, partial [Steroidobacteraceae bacterium]|nr:SufD family Fe-S cluster assembly protein [Steroidobacteraceae bacterium]
NLRPLERQSFTPAPLNPGAAAAAAPAELPQRLSGFARYVFLDGNFAPALSDPLEAGPARILPLAVFESGSPPAPAHAGRDQRFALLNAAFATDGASIAVPATAAGPARIELLFVASAAAEAGASYPRVELRLEPEARLTLIERHLGVSDGASFVASAVAAELDRGAALEHYRLQELGARAILFDSLSATLGADARYHLRAIGSGALAARSSIQVRLAGERAGLALAAASLGDRQQLQDTYAAVEHLAPNTRTEETFRGIAAGRARIAFNGRMMVAREARGADSRQSLRGLLAGADAEIDVRPQLEIYTDEVSASHGATAGKLDEQMLFYLLARGLDRETAQRALKWAFLGDVVARIEPPQLRQQIETRLAAQMLGGATFREFL